MSVLLFFRYFSSDNSNLDSNLKGQLSTIKRLEHPGRGLCVLCAENQQNSISVESDPNNSESVVRVSVIRELQDEAVKSSVQSFCTEDYSRMLKSVNLDNPFDSS